MILRQFGRDEHSFVLKTRGWREVEKVCDLGLGLIAARLAPLVQLMLIGSKSVPGGFHAAVASGHLGNVHLDDVREPLLQALIDGGLPSTAAGALVKLVFDEAVAHGQAPILEWAPLAYDIVVGALVGLADEAVAPGEPKAATGAPGRRPSPTAKPASRKSTPPAR